MEAIYDRHGDVVAWLSENRIFDMSGAAIALIEGDNVFSFPGKHLGVIDRGYFRDHAGHAVGFLIWAHDGPALPERNIIPRPPEKKVIPYNFGTSIPPIPSLASKHWSTISWFEFIYGHIGSQAQFSQLRAAAAH